MRAVAQLNMPIPDDLHHKAKVIAVTKGVSLKEFVIAAIEDAIKRQEKAK